MALKDRFHSRVNHDTNVPEYALYLSYDETWIDFQTINVEDRLFINNNLVSFYSHSGGMLSKHEVYFRYDDPTFFFTNGFSGITQDSDHNYTRISFKSNDYPDEHIISEEDKLNYSNNYKDASFTLSGIMFPSSDTSIVTASRVEGTLYDRLYSRSQNVSINWISSNTAKLTFDGNYKKITSGQFGPGDVIEVTGNPFIFDSGSYTSSGTPSISVYKGVKFSNEQIYAKIGKLAKPHIVADHANQRITWNKPEWSDYGYDVYKDGEYWKTVLTEYVNIPTEDYLEKHSYTVIARANSKAYVDPSLNILYAYNADPETYGIYRAVVTFVAYTASDHSNSIEFYKLQKPENIRVAQRVTYNSVNLSWDNVAHANGYRVYLNDVLQGISVYNEYRINNLTVGTHLVKVQALDTNGVAMSSDISDIFEFEIDVLETPIINLNSSGDGLSWYNYDTSINKPTGYVVEDLFTGEWIYLNTVSTLNYLLDTDASKMSPGVHTFRVKAIVLENGVESSVWSSSWSNTIEIAIDTLDTPQIEWEVYLYEQTSNIIWDAIPNASYYNIYVDDVKVNVNPVTTNRYEGLEDLFGNTPGYYKVQVRAMSVSVIHEDSPNSNSIFYVVTKLDAPESIGLQPDGTLTWAEVTNDYYNEDDISTYDIYLNDEYYATTTATSYAITEIAPGSEANTVYLQTRCNTQALSHPNPKFNKSDFSDIATIGKLATPVNLRTTTEGYLVWDVTPNAKQYSVYTEGSFIDTVNTNQYLIPNKMPRTFKFTIKANGWGNLVDSDMSNVLTVNVIKLEAPLVDVNAMEKYISWGYITNADFYDIYLNGTKIQSVTSNRFYYDGHLVDGLNELYVIANSYNKLNIPSNKSNIITTSTTSQMAFYVRIKENGIYSQPMEIEMPFTRIDKRDDSLDEATVTLALNTKKKPYAAYTDVELNLATEDGNNVYKKWYMIVAIDNVTERPVGEKRLFSHTINLISRDRLLQNTFVPNMSITQPESFIYRSYENITNSITPNYGGNLILEDRDAFIATGSNHTLDEDAFWGRVSVNSGINPNFVNNVPMNIYEDVSFALPYTTTRSIFNGYVTQLSDFWSGLGLMFGATNKDVKYKETRYMPITQRWFIRKHNPNITDQYAKRLDDPEIEIATYTYSDGKAYPKFRFLDSQYYLQNKGVAEWDIIYTIDDIPDGAFVSPRYDKDRRMNLKLMYSFDFVDKEYDAPLDKILPMDWRKRFAGIYNRYTSCPPDQSFRIVYSGINVGTIQKDEPDFFISVADCLEKICNIVNLIKTDETPEYSIDPVILDLTKDIPCYQLKFEGKSLFECLETIGKEFFGIPYLIDDTNVISFQVLNELNTMLGEVPSRDLPEISTTESSIENNSTGYVTDVENMISKNNVEVYPAPNYWITPRSTDETATFVESSNAGIVLDKPIAYLKDIIVSNYLKNNPESQVSIIGYIYEKTFYDALSTSVEGKGSALYWQIGDNKIYGLGLIPELESSGLRGALGLENNRYVIQNILKSRLNIDIDSDMVKNLKFQIVYIPYSNTNIYTEKFNTYDFERSAYTAYNQTDAVVSDTAFGAATNKEIQRLGNNSIFKEYIVSHINQCPKVGDAVKLNDEVYYATVVSYNFLNRYIQCIVEYSKDYNKINPRMGIDSDYRAYEIYNSDFVNRTLNINHYCYLSNKEDYILNDANRTGVWPMIMERAIQGESTDSLSQFYVNVYNEDDNGVLCPVTYKDFYGNEQTIDYGFALHATRLNLRNSIAFTTNMLDNFAAGSLSNNNDTFEGKYRQEYIRYVDEYGKVKAVQIALCNPTIDQLYGTNKNRYYYDYPKCNKLSGDLKNLLNECVTNETYYVDKDNREALTFTYQMHFKSDEKEYSLHKGLTNNIFKNTNDNSIISNAIFVGYRGSIKSKENISYSVEDVLGKASIGITENGTRYVDELTIRTNNRSYDGYALIYPQTNTGFNEIIYSYEMNIPANSTITLNKTYFNFKDKLDK